MKRVAKGIARMLIFTMVLIGFAVPFTYADAPSIWAKDTIAEAINLQLATEKVLSDYQKPITREEFAEVAVQLYKALGGNVGNQVKENPFTDTNNPTVLQAYHLGIISGKSATSFAPNASITRQELSVILVRTMKALDSKFQPTVSKSISFADGNEIASWAIKEVQYMFDQGIIQGVGGSRIEPTGLTTREQAIVLTVRTFKVYEKMLGQADVLRVWQGTDANTLDPHATNDQPSSRVMKQIYETLVNQNENMEIESGLAESWRYIDDLTIEFKLKKGVKFHNGEELTSRDVKFTLLRALESPNVGHIVGAIDPDGIKIVDDYTIRISTIEPFTPLLAHLAHTGASILNEKAVIATGDDYGFNPVGTGPFKFYKWIIWDSIELTKFDDYHGEKAKVEGVVFKNAIQGESIFDDVMNGQIDIAYNILPLDIECVEENEMLKLYRDVNLSTSYIGFNVQKKPFNDVRVRQAINYAVDVEVILETVMDGAGQQANGPLGPNVWASNQSLKSYEYNIEKAKKLLADAGYPNGFKTSILINDNQSRMWIAEIVQSQLKAVNIEVEIKVVEWGTYLDSTAMGDHDMFILGWVTVTGDPDYGLYPLFHSSQFGDAGNRTFYGNDKLDELLEKGRVETDPEIRKEYYLKAQEIIREEAPWIFLYTGEEMTVARNNVKGFKQHPAGHHKLSGVYLE